MDHRRVNSGGLAIKTLEQTFEDALPGDLAFGGSIIALFLEGWPELLGRDEEGAGLADGLEVAVDLDGPGTVSIPEHTAVHLAPQFGHLGSLGIDGQLLRLTVERLNFLAGGEVLVGHCAVGDLGIDQGHAERLVPEQGGQRLQAHPAIDGLGGQGMPQLVRGHVANAGGVILMAELA
jgi:hypothetical protein